MLTQMAGARSQIITVQRAIENPNSYGEMVRVWFPYKKIRANVATQSAKELMQGEQISARRGVVFQIHKKAIDLRDDDRIDFGGTICEISAIVSGDSRQQFIDVICTAKIQEGI